MSSVLWSFMNCLAVVFVKEDFLSTFLKRKKDRWIFICVWMFYFLFHFMTKVENYIINLIQDATVTVIVCWLGYEAALRIKILIFQEMFLHYSLCHPHHNPQMGYLSVHYY